MRLSATTLWLMLSVIECHPSFFGSWFKGSPVKNSPLRERLLDSSAVDRIAPGWTAAPVHLEFSSWDATPIDESTHASFESFWHTYIDQQGPEQKKWLDMDIKTFPAKYPVNIEHFPLLKALQEAYNAGAPRSELDRLVGDVMSKLGSFDEGTFLENVKIAIAIELLAKLSEYDRDLYQIRPLSAAVRELAQPKLTELYNKFREDKRDRLRNLVNLVLKKWKQRETTVQTQSQ